MDQLVLESNSLKNRIFIYALILFTFSYFAAATLYLSQGKSFGFIMVAGILTNLLLLLWNRKSKKYFVWQIQIFAFVFYIANTIGFFMVNGIDGSAPIALILFSALMFSLFSLRFSLIVILIPVLLLTVQIILQLYFGVKVEPYPSLVDEYIDKIFICFLTIICIGLLIRSYIVKNEKEHNLLLRMQMDVKSKNDELSASEEELRQQAEELTTLNQNLDNANNKLQVQFRTPMNGLVGMMDILEGTEGLNEKQLNYIQTMKESSSDLMLIINDVLTLSKLESNGVQLNPTSIDLVKLLEHSIKLVEGKVKEHSIDLSVDIDPLIPKEVVLDKLRLSQVVNNLLNNAVKFTKEGKVNVIAKLSPNNRIKIEIEDHGVGIRAEEKEHLFQKYFQMPVMDGITATFEIQKQLKEKAPSIIGVSAKAMEGDRETFLEKGMDDFIPKPVTINMLVAMLEKHFAN